MTDEREGRELALRLILKYFQDWGQSVEERDAALVEAADWADLEAGLFEDLIQDCFPLGKIEHEVEAVFQVMLRERRE